MPHPHRRGATVLVGLAAAALITVPTRQAAAGPVLQRQVIGYSVQHRPIVAYHLGNPSLRRVDVVIGQMHGDEHAGVRVVNALIRGGRISGVNLWVIPTMNPDGDAAHTRQNAHHVDLNRNWPVSWTRLTGQYYSGPRPLSEPESRAVRAFLLRVRPHDIVSLHQPLSGVDTTDGGAVDPALRRRLERELGLRAKPFRCHSVCHGGMTRWYTRHHYGVAITVEFGAHPSARYLTRGAPRGIVAALGGRRSG
ncbi:M14 family zinc carboxypeptidase [uncultured Jatrophihabitans sp.]|uniref:M14 family zinc carboxypeptidase n=1 Tax=uncultured Jatrophihabitans sp. TaxID=1610747 RepID=UPI0035CBD40C